MVDCLYELAAAIDVFEEAGTTSAALPLGRDRGDGPTFTPAESIQLDEAFETKAYYQRRQVVAAKAAILITNHFVEQLKAIAGDDPRLIDAAGRAASEFPDITAFRDFVAHLDERRRMRFHRRVDGRVQARQGALPELEFNGSRNVMDIFVWQGVIVDNDYVVALASDSDVAREGRFAMTQATLEKVSDILEEVTAAVAGRFPERPF